MRDKGMELGLTTESDIEEMVNAWEIWASDDDSSVAMMHGEILIQR
jgi:hypothetical protein